MKNKTKKFSIVANVLRKFVFDNRRLENLVERRTKRAERWTKRDVRHIESPALRTHIQSAPLALTLTNFCQQAHNRAHLIYRRAKRAQIVA